MEGGIDEEGRKSVRWEEEMDEYGVKGNMDINKGSGSIAVIERLYAKALALGPVVSSTMRLVLHAGLLQDQCWLSYAV